MSDIESSVEMHYEDNQLLDRILDKLLSSGADLNHLTAEDLAPIEEFHIGGREATKRAIDKMALQKEQYLLDVGCGIGGAARYIAKTIDCDVKGLDLTREYISIAKLLTEKSQLTDKVSFDVSSALTMPYQEQTFDAVISMHVAMNIRDRQTLYNEIARVMRPGSVFYLFDVMKKNDQELTFPLPWATHENESHLTSLNEMKQLLKNSGFYIDEVNDRSQFSLDFFTKGFSQAKNSTLPTGPALIMGETAKIKMENVVNMLVQGAIVPIEMVVKLKK